ncbi:hypothetical protein KSP39_PZI018987 [Platanthera zijinensis]|uniref:Uncharacterized protein n=1 Tax=Platanthera zijinensis TaxID=2320716 RepID=A0AAP0FYE0_9ASPA
MLRLGEQEVGSGVGLDCWRAQNCIKTFKWSAADDQAPFDNPAGHQSGGKLFDKFFQAPFENYRRERVPARRFAAGLASTIHRPRRPFPLSSPDQRERQSRAKSSASPDRSSSDGMFGSQTIFHDCSGGHAIPQNSPGMVQGNSRVRFSARELVGSGYKYSGVPGTV